MKFIIILVLLFFVIVSPFLRMFIKNIPLEWFYGGKDFILYIKEKKWEKFNYYGIEMFIGMFGHGKTLSMTHKARLIYKQFGDNVRFFSNYKLVDIPYTPLINFNQLMEIGEEDDPSIVGTVVLIDEIEFVLNNRNFANFPLELLSLLSQQRKKRVFILTSCQRFFQTDKLFRSLATHAIDCRKIWRFQNVKYYDAWDYENAVNSQILKPIKNIWWFVRDVDYNSYDTEQMISQDSADQFISNEESIVRKGLDVSVKADAIREKRLRHKRRVPKKAR